MNYQISETAPGDELWSYIEHYSPQTLRYIASASPHSSYRCFIANHAEQQFLGLSIVEIGPLGFGPLAARTVGCLENILVLEPHRRRGIGTALVRAALQAAWAAGACHVWWTVPYENEGAIAFYSSLGALFIAEEDPDSPTPEKYYTVVLPGPNRPPK